MQASHKKNASMDDEELQKPRMQTMVFPVG